MFIPTSGVVQASMSLLTSISCPIRLRVNIIAQTSTYVTKRILMKNGVVFFFFFPNTSTRFCFHSLMITIFFLASCFWGIEIWVVLNLSKLFLYFYMLI